MPARLFRLSFSGELAYEIAVPAAMATRSSRAVEAGRDFDVMPYGTEALGVMRIEKGHLAGNELNGQTTARDLGLGRMMSKKKDFIGRVMAGRPGLMTRTGRRWSASGRSSGETAARRRAFPALGARAIAANDQGYMTSVAFSPTLGHWIGLGLLKRGPDAHRRTRRAYDPVRGPDVEVEICEPVFVDPEGARVRG